MDEIDKTIKEAEETMARFTAIEENGKEKILHYFDRIHNHLFTFNNLMIAGFFTLSQLKVNVPVWMIIIPLINLWFLIYVEYRMMEKSRFESNIMSQPKSKLDKYGKSINRTTLISLLSIIASLLVTIVFLCLLFRM